MITVSIKLALICFLDQCHPVLLGNNTPIGEFSITQRYTSQPGYGGDVLKFDEDDKTVYAIHRVWTGNPSERRVERLKSQLVGDRQSVTNGCINVSNDVYAKLVDCCSGSVLKIVD